MAYVIIVAVLLVVQTAVFIYVMRRSMADNYQRIKSAVIQAGCPARSLGVSMRQMEAEFSQLRDELQSVRRNQNDVSVKVSVLETAQKEQDEQRRRTPIDIGVRF